MWELESSSDSTDDSAAVPLPTVPSESLLVPDKFQQHRIVAFLRSHSEMSQSEKRERRVFKLADPLPFLDQNASINVEDQQSKRGQCDR